MHYFQTRRGRRPRRFLRSAVVLLLFTYLLGAQTPAGEIQLEVKDPSGVAMKASGTLESVAPGVQRRFATDGSGVYKFTDLPYGRYRLEISKSGFATQSVFVDVESQGPVRAHHHHGNQRANLQSGRCFRNSTCRERI